MIHAAPAPIGIPRPEHPRPIFRREPWVNFNGRWRFTFDPHDQGEQLRWYRVKDPAATLSSDRFGAPGLSGSGALTEDPFGDEIIVPFPWESRLSRIAEPAYKGAAWYQRAIVVPHEWALGETPAAPPIAPSMTADGTQAESGLPSVEDAAPTVSTTGTGVRWRLHPFLCFGAVDWNAKVWINGRFIAEHDGGYSPFALDISHYVRPGVPATLTVRVWDTSAADTPIGKQTVRWYTPSSGIWQTVSLEGRPAVYVDQIHVTPHFEDGRATFAITVRKVAGAGSTIACTATVRSDDGSFPDVTGALVHAASAVDALPVAATVSLEVTVPSPKTWSPETPHLYECTVTLTPEAGNRASGSSAGSAGPVPAEPDTIHTYFGLRSISKERWEGRDYEYVYLNGEPVYLRGALDQAFHPDGLHAYPSDEAIRADVQAAKDLGLNMLRCHIKINDPRYYYWCDRLGVLVMYDFPSASVYTPRSRANWEQTFRDALARDYSHPSIIAWILFNETWGLEEHQTPASWQWVKERYEETRLLDPSRLVEDNSACLYDHVDTDINTWHFYIDEYDRARRHVERVVQQTYEGSPFNYVSSIYSGTDGVDTYRQGMQPLLNSEYAGLSARQGDRDISYTFKFLTTDLRRHDKICGYVYTELADIEWEHNGLLNYDRSAKEFGYETHFPTMTVADLNGADFVGLDCPPCQTLPPGHAFNAPAFVSHWDRRRLEHATLRWRVSLVDRFGERRDVTQGERALTPRQYGVAEAGEVAFMLPDEPGLVTVALWLEAPDGAIRARNYVNVDLHPLRGGADGPQTLAETTGPGYALRFRPGDFADTSWPNARLGARGAKFGASGYGWVEYALTLPTGLAINAVRRLRLRFEAGARTARERIGWKNPLYVLGSDYPQTEALKLPGDVDISVNGVPWQRVRLPDDPADAAGVLSAHLSEHWEPCSYGTLVTLDAEGARARQMLDSASDGQLVVRFEVPADGVCGGLNLYGADMGAHPIDPTIFLDG